MKAIKTLIVAVMAFCAVSSYAQPGIGTVSPSGYAHPGFLTNSTAVLIQPLSLSNIPVTMAYILPFPKDGFGVFARLGGTNVSGDTTNLATNIVITLEGIIKTPNGHTQVVDNATLTVTTPTTASGLNLGYDYLTNYLSFSTTSQQEAALRRCDGVRVRSIQNTNTTSLWVSNLFQLR